MIESLYNQHPIVKKEVVFKACYVIYNSKDELHFNFVKSSQKFELFTKYKSFLGGSINLTHYVCL